MAGTSNEGDSAPEDAAPGWRRGVALAVTAQLLSVMGFSCAVSFLPLFIQTLGIPSPERAALWAGSLSFSQAMMVAICSPFWGIVADRHGAKLMVCRAVFGGGVVFVAISFAGQVEQLLFLFLLLGFFTGVNTAIVTLVSGIAPRRHLGAAIGACQTGVFVGVSLGPTVGGVLADAFSFRVGVRGGAALLLLAGAITLVGITEPPRVVAPAAPLARRRGVLAGFRVAGLPRPLLLLIGLTFLIQFSLQMMSPVLPIYVQQLAPGVTRVATVVGLVLGVGGVASAFGALLVGRAGDRFGQRRALGWTAAGGGLALGLQAFVGGIAPLLGLRALSGFFTGGLSAGTNASIGALVPSGSRGAAFGVAGSAFSLGNAFGPLLGGFLAEGLGPRAVIGLGAAALGCGWILVQAVVRAEARAEVDAGAAGTP